MAFLVLLYFHVLTLNNFVFNCKNYFHIKGCTMGKICALAYTNIFMDHFERKSIYPVLQVPSRSYFRFIDDILSIWTGSNDQPITFLNDLNTKNNSLKFEYKISQSNIPFLEMEVYLKNNKLYTMIYRKETERENFFAY